MYLGSILSHFKPYKIAKILWFLGVHPQTTLKFYIYATTFIHAVSPLYVSGLESL